jgi:hypothetical protein
MPILYNPMNKDFSQTEGQDERGEPLKLTLKEQASLDLKPRLKRERRRYRLTRPYEYERKIYDSLNEIIVFWVLDSYQYYEDCELTIDTIVNPRYKAPAKVPGKLEKFVDNGGEFTHSKITFDKCTTEYVYHEYNPFDFVKGHVWLTPPSFMHDGIDVATSIRPPVMDTDISSLGPAMWRFLSPLRPGVDLGINVVEARDFTRLVVGRVTSLKSIISKLSNPKGLANWVLAINFGWKPLVSDIRKVINLFGKFERRVDFILRNGGLPLYRRTPDWEPEVTEEVLFEYTGPEDQGWMRDIPFPSGWEDPPGQPGDGQTRFECKLTCRKTTVEAGSGVFIYFLGDLPPTKPEIRLRLLGLIPNESLLWEATGWTWLIDWFTNLGDVIANIRATLRDRLVSLYAYNQLHTVREYTWTATNGYYRVKCVRVFDTKRRERIHPFGLTTEVSLTDLQLGILLALGITRS